MGDSLVLTGAGGCNLDRLQHLAGWIPDLAKACDGCSKTASFLGKVNQCQDANISTS